MRKRYKNKKRSCGLCKPFKRNIEKRWKPKELAMLKEFETANKKKEDLS